MRGKTLIGLCMPLVAIGAACSDGDAAPATTTSAIVTAPTSTAPATTQPATTQPTNTTAPTTTAPATQPTSVAPTTAPPTVSPGSVEEQVVSAAVESWRLLNEARLDPFNDEKVRAAGRAHSGANQQRLVEILARYRENNWRSLTNPEVPASVTPYPGEVVVDQAAGTASVTYCLVNSNILVQTGGNPDGSDLVVNDDVSSSRVRVDLVLVDGRWLDDSGELITEWKDATTCPDLA